MIITPKGLTIFLPRNYSFALIARLYPKVDAFKVLETTQGIYKMHSMFSFITGLICFLLALSPIQIALYTFIITFIFFIFRLSGILIFSGTINVLILYSRLSGFGVLTVILLAIGFFRVGIFGTLAFIVARIVVEEISILIDRKIGRDFGIKMGMDPIIAKEGAMLLAPAKDFLRAYKFYAVRFGFPIDLEVSQKELQKNNWIHVWDDFVKKWPEASQRFPKEDEENQNANIEYVLKKGISFYKKEDYQSALKEFNHVISIDNQNKYAYYYRAVTNHKLGEKNTVLSDLKIAAKFGHQKAINILKRKGIDY
jgi:hypothetical protein